MSVKRNRNMTNTILVLLSVIMAFVCGYFFPQFMLSTSWIGDVFFNMLKILVLPLVFSAIVSAITHVGNFKQLGNMGIFTVGYAVLSAVIAVSIGLLLFNVFSPGLGVNTSFAQTLSEHIKSAESLSFHNFIMGLFPSNILEAAVKFEVMPIVIFCVGFGRACLSCGQEAAAVVNVINHLRNIMVKMISWVIVLSPLGIFSLLGAGVAKSIAQNQLVDDFKALGMFVAVFLLGLTLQFLWQLLVIKFIAKKAIGSYLKSSSPALATAFGTSSSIATLPVTMNCAESLQVRPDINRFVLPLAATINLGATVMYEASAALFFAQVLGMNLSFSGQVVVFITSIIAGMGATGIPESGLITMVTVLRAVNIPVSAMSIILPLDRILDRFRTVVNTWGDLCCASAVNELVINKEKKQKSAALES